ANLLAGEDGESGMVEAIDRHCHKSANRRGEDQLLNTLNKNFSNIPEYLQTNPASHSFTISHYETSVEYHLYQFVDNNLDSINADFAKLFQSDSKGYSHCSNPFLVELFQSEAIMIHCQPSNPDTIISARYSSAHMLKHSKKHAKLPTEKNVPEVTMPTRVAQINNALNDLFSTLETTSIWPIFHINPYSDYSNQALNQTSVVAQIKSWSLPSLVINMALNLSTSFTFDEFLTRYRSVTNSIGLDASRDSKSQIDAFATISGLIAGSDYVLGNTKIFLSFSKWKNLEDSLRSAILDEKSLTTEKNYPGFIKRGDNDSICSGYESNRNLTIPSQFPGQASQLYEKEEFNNSNLQNLESSENFSISNYNDSGFVALIDKQAPLQTSIKNPKITKAVELDDLSPESQAKDLKSKKEKKIEAKPLTFARKSWVRLTWFLTWWIPSCCLSKCGKMTRPDVQMAWREKVAICLLIFFSWCILLFMNIGLGLIFCPPEEAYPVDDLAKAQGKSAVAYMHGDIYDLVKLAKYSHAKSPNLPNGITADDMEPLEGKDITSLFPLDPQVYCQGLDNIPDRYEFNWQIDNNYMEYNTIVASQDFPRWVHRTNIFNGQPVSKDPLWYKNTALPYLKGLRTGTVVYPKKIINQYRDWQWNIGVINGKVYDISIYVNNTRTVQSAKWMPTEVVEIFKFSATNDIKNGDITELWNGLQLDKPERKEAVMTCLDNLFYVGKIDRSELISCQVTNILLLVFSGIALSVAAVKFLAALQLSGKRDPQDYDKFVILQVPCYTEDEESIRRTIESLACLQYSDNHKLIFVIAD
ncbi:glycosyltransferase family 2 protein, partial [Conidiobolus coronatus NRRL 28638]